MLLKCVGKKSLFWFWEEEVINGLFYPYLLQMLFTRNMSYLWLRHFVEFYGLGARFPKLVDTFQSCHFLINRFPISYFLDFLSLID